jgi:hypothetical protein
MEPIAEGSGALHVGQRDSVGTISDIHWEHIDSSSNSTIGFEQSMQARGNSKSAMGRYHRVCIMTNSYCNTEGELTFC